MSKALVKDAAIEKGDRKEERMEEPAEGRQMNTGQREPGEPSTHRKDRENQNVVENVEKIKEQKEDQKNLFGEMQREESTTRKGQGRK